MATIDADAHVVESEHTWDYMDPSERRYRPVLVSPNGAPEERPVRSILDTGSARSYWLIERHAGLRLGFIEASGSWLPWVIKDIRRRAEGRKLPEHFLEALRIFVTCYTSDDISYITQQAGAGVLMIGTDYGHQDMSVELDALRTLRERGDLDPVVAQKILDDNPRALYGL